MLAMAGIGLGSSMYVNGLRDKYGTVQDFRTIGCFQVRYSAVPGVEEENICSIIMILALIQEIVKPVLSSPLQRTNGSSVAQFCESRFLQ